MVTQPARIQYWDQARLWWLGRKARSRYHVPHLGAGAGPSPPLLLEAARPCPPIASPVFPFPGMRSHLSIFCFGERKGRTNEEFALNVFFFFLNTINHQNSLKDHGNCFEK